ncbi:arsenate reductase/protein-tyrosine-phosphatase family protein [Mycolicibacterium pyrenivorans]|uniref:arsenate reductase/protein-tyrosine-phosphatase family protein n=1 Tax=Mycolicibacterium pyrenivorans TaxID=187102 RepID=UPI0021F2FD1C|nr:helix-turn-helix domain-containing protein [Mycolicibacterium pyrenivorans]MCV7150637.1 helix-turn-helix domain-containing protein [Mycolicibacterium pyrenivorans]
MSIEVNAGTARRAAVFAALSDPARLAIVDHLLLADASPSELRAVLDMQSNLLAHHLGVLKRAGVVRDTRSEADGRRTYLSLNRPALETLVPSAQRRAHRVVFVCTQNSARSQLAAAIWNRRSELPATSAGTHPAARVHPGAVAAARRHKLHLRPHTPRHLGDVLAADDLVIAVCDNAHEELPGELTRLHWSVPDPARTERVEAFDAAVGELTDRIVHLVPNVKSA